jgi:kynurenine formamidase
MTQTTGSPYDGTGHRSPQWWPSRYGADDEIGAANELTEDRTFAALQIPRQGRIIELTRVIGPSIPFYPPRQWNQLVLSHESLEGFRSEESESDMGAFEEVVNQSYQIGCHLDGLCHITIDGRFYNGNHYRDVFTPTGMRKLGIENTRPWVSRGVCLDIAAVLGTERLEGGFSIQPEHLEAAEERQGIQVQPGDAVFVHTGWGRLWGKDDPAYAATEPGVGWEGAHWLTGRRVSLVAADNWGFEPVPFEKETRPFVVHQHLLAESGTQVLENVDTSVLAAEGISEFLFILTPIKTAGSTASMASPLALI